MRSDNALAGSAEAARIEQRLGGVFADCLRAFHAFGELAELAESLRVLSLNAELAAGRAGDKGRAVRALTQYTRELVNRLAQIQDETARLMSGTYEHSAAAMRVLHQMRLLDRALVETDRRGGGGSARRHLADGRSGSKRRLDDAVAMMVRNVDALDGRTRVVVEVVSASDSIATNIAIEASAAGVHEAEFRTVADTMRRYVERLRVMVDEASGAVRDATQKAAGLQRLGARAAG